MSRIQAPDTWGFWELRSERPLGLPEGRLRTGIHFGEVAKRRDGDLFGDAVNIASRLESEAEPGQIVVSQVVADQLDGVELEDLGERTLKNVP